MNRFTTCAGMRVGFDIRQHRDVDRIELRDLVARVASDPERWRSLVHHGTGRRYFQELWRDAHVDVWVISWAHGNDTGFHDHDVSSGAMAVVEGELIEERLVLGPAPREVRHGAGQVFDLHAAQVQRMRQDSFTPEASVQAYSPVLWRMGSSVIDRDGTLRRQSISYAGELRPLEAAS